MPQRGQAGRLHRLRPQLADCGLPESWIPRTSASAPELQVRRSGKVARGSAHSARGVTWERTEGRPGKWHKAAKVRARNQNRSGFVWPELRRREWDSVRQGHKDGSGPDFETLDVMLGVWSCGCLGAEWQTFCAEVIPGLHCGDWRLGEWLEGYAIARQTLLGAGPEVSAL